MSKRPTTHTSKGYSTGDTVRHVFVANKEASRAYCKANGATSEYTRKSTGGFRSTFKRA